MPGCLKRPLHWIAKEKTHPDRTSQCLKKKLPARSRKEKRIKIFPLEGNPISKFITPKA